MSGDIVPRAKASHRVRYRYLLLQVDAGPSPAPDRSALIRMLQAAAPTGWGSWLTRYDGKHAILRVNRGAEDDAREVLEKGALATGSVRLRPLLTSGTIAGLERKHRGAAALRQGRA